MEQVLKYIETGKKKEPYADAEADDTRKESAPTAFS